MNERQQAEVVYVGGTAHIVFPNPEADALGPSTTITRGPEVTEIFNLHASRPMPKPPGGSQEPQEPPAT